MAFGGENAESYYDEGVTAAMTGDVERAVRSFEKAIRMDNSMSSAYHQLGRCYLRVGKGDQAIALLTQVVTRRPEQVPPRLDLGYAFLSAGRLEDARRQFNQVLMLEGGNARAQLGLAQASFQSGAWVAAMNEARTAVAIGGVNTFAGLYLLGRAAKLSGDYEAATGALKKADALLEKTIEKTGGDKPESHYLRGEVAYIQDNFAAALDHYRTAQGHAKHGKSYTAYGENFGLADILARQGLCLQRMGHTDRAREVGARIGELDPGHKIGKALREG